MFIAALILLLHTAPRTAPTDSTCIVTTIDVDDVDFGGHRYDGPEHVRELRVGNLSGGIHLWLLDTNLDGAERYDLVAMTLTPDPTGSSEDFIPLRKIDWAAGDPPRKERICWR